MNDELHRIALEDLGVLRVGGADALSFLQGQLSNDVTRLGSGRTLLAGFHNPQGRAIALLRLVALADAELLAVLPRELVEPVRERLSKYVLRAKVTVSDVSSQWRVSAVASATDLARGEPAALSPADLPAPHTGAHHRLGERHWLTVDEHPVRWLEIAPRTAPGGAAHEAARDQWRVLDIRAGLAQVYRATCEHFVAQMLNLDALGAIAFDKGCYTGQEVIARAHYRGRVKRRAQRWRSRDTLALAPGDAGVLADGRTFTVVDAARLPDGRCEFLAVARLPGAESEAAGGTGTAAPLAAESLPLPYPLPE